jgi:serine/threonine-protein kinase
MGVVLLATDTELERPVALKLLAPELAHDPLFRERFLRESRMAAAIEHPGIVPIYEAGTFGDQLFIAMRYVPGRDLATVLRAEAPLDPVRALALATQLAEALDAAHARGLVHRDVKPANVLLEPGDPERALLTDFGLTHRHGQTAAWSTGGPVGTLDYMAPELIERGAVDARADQYSLACLLFHCLAGSPPFEADSDAGLLYAQVHAPRPRLSERRPGLGGSLDGVLLRGLARDPAERYPDCRSLVVDAWRRLPGGTTPRGEPATAGLDGRSRPKTTAVLAVASGAIVVLVLAVFAARVLPPGGSPSPAADGSPGGPSSPANPGGVSFPTAPPGTRPAIVFASNRAGNYDIYWMDPTEAVPRVIEVSDLDEMTPDVSPDGKRIAYAAGRDGARDIWIMNADGTGNERVTFDPADDWAPDWSPDGKQLVFTTRRNPPGENIDILLLSDRGSGFDEALAFNLSSRRAIEMHPQWSPDGRLVLFSTNERIAGREIATMNPDPANRNVTFRNESDEQSQEPTWVPPGNQVIFGQGPAPNRTRLSRLDLDTGQTEPLTSGGWNESFPDVSPDGTAVVFSRGPQGASELYLMDLDGGEPRPLTVDMKDAIQADWAYLADPR